MSVSTKAPSAAAINHLLTRGVQEVIDRDHLVKQLSLGRPLRVKHGVDPSGSELHLGHAVVYEKLRQFQALGHTIVFLLGTFTARFGDPTDRGSSRAMQPRAEVEKRAKTYVQQLTAILNIKKIEVRSNSQWYDKMSAEGLLQLLSEFTVSRMLERDMFQERLMEGLEIGLHEPVYPVLQGYDSVQLKSDVTVIGSDQKFNELQARPLQERAGQTPQDLVIMPILAGLDGVRKMGKSYNNYIAITDRPTDMYGKVMSIPDSLIPTYFELVTRVSDAELADIRQAIVDRRANPRELKARLAAEIVTIYHSGAAAVKAGKEFNRVFRDKQAPSSVPTVRLKKKTLSLVDLLVATKLVTSKSEARRVILQGGVKINDVKVEDPGQLITISGQTIQVGKRKFIKITVGK